GRWPARCRGHCRPAVTAPAALRAEGESLYLYLPRRCAQSTRPVRSQAEAQRAARPEAARLDAGEGPLRLHPEGGRAPPGQPAEVEEAWAVRHGPFRL